MVNTLPQKENNITQSRKRIRYLQRMQSKYEYAYEFSETIAVVRKLPWRELPGLYYLIRAAMNLFLLVPSMPSLIRTVLRYILGRPLENYQDYIFYPRSPLPKQEVIHDFQQDLQFGLQRVVGVNPAIFRAVSSKQPLPDKISEPDVRRIYAEQINEPHYAAAVSQKRLYVLDYSVLDILQQNTGQIDGGRKQYVTTPIVVLFQQTDGLLLPLAIQLYQDDRPDNPVYSAKDGNLWIAAKTFAQIADGNHHILYTHATRIHYVMEAIIMASRRQLYSTHPLAVLLQPHLRYTLMINHQHTFLRNRKGRPGRFGELFAGDYDATTQCMADGMTSFDFKAFAFPNDIKRREVDNPDLFYPYRDDGILLWDAIQNFSKEYISVYYSSDADVIEDYELQAWANDIAASNRGRIPGFPQKIMSTKELAETIGHIIFLCTAYHSCIHFNQYSYPGFVPNMPYSAYIQPPDGKESDINAEELFRIQPAFRAAYSQTWTFFLTNFRVNRIGQYPLQRFDPDACQVIERFNLRLREIEIHIDEKNKTRPVSYERMHPAVIPNGVTV